MSKNDLLDQIVRITGIEVDQAIKAIAAVYAGQLDLALPASYEGQPVEFTIDIVIHKPPPPGPAKKIRPGLRDAGALIKYIVDSTGISPEDAGTVLGLVTQGFVENGFGAGLRLAVPEDS